MSYLYRSIKYLLVVKSPLCRLSNTKETNIWHIWLMFQRAQHISRNIRIIFNSTLYQNDWSYLCSLRYFPCHLRVCDNVGVLVSSEVPWTNRQLVTEGSYSGWDCCRYTVGRDILSWCLASKLSLFIKYNHINKFWYWIRLYILIYFNSLVHYHWWGIWCEEFLVEPHARGYASSEPERKKNNSENNVIVWKQCDFYAFHNYKFESRT